MHSLIIEIKSDKNDANNCEYILDNACGHEIDYYEEVEYDDYFTDLESCFDELGITPDLNERTLMVKDMGLLNDDIDSWKKRVIELLTKPNSELSIWEIYNEITPFVGLKFIYWGDLICAPKMRLYFARGGEGKKFYIGKVFDYHV